jgi:hypothetical protein
MPIGLYIGRRGWGMRAIGKTEMCPVELLSSFVSSVERGEPNVSLLDIVALARDLNAKPTELLEEIL